MNAHTTIERPPLDDILTLVPTCEPGSAIYELRSKLRSHRNVASALIANTPSDSARALAWMAAETTSAWVYAQADERTLSEIARFSNRLLLTAIQAEAMFDDGVGA